jgi:hypothetical protein
MSGETRWTKLMDMRTKLGSVSTKLGSVSTKLGSEGMKLVSAPIGFPLGGLSFTHEPTSYALIFPKLADEPVSFTRAVPSFTRSVPSFTRAAPSFTRGDLKLVDGRLKLMDMVAKRVGARQRLKGPGKRHEERRKEPRCRFLEEGQDRGPAPTTPG